MYSARRVVRRNPATDLPQVKRKCESPLQDIDEYAVRVPGSQRVVGDRARWRRLRAGIGDVDQASPFAGGRALAAVSTTCSLPG